MASICLLLVAMLLSCARAVEEYQVPVNTNMTAIATTPGIGASLSLTCVILGYPTPNNHWTKDGARLQPDERTSISRGRFLSQLTVSRLTASDSGLYGCHANNSYSSHSDTVQINVEQKIVPVNCTNTKRPFNCDQLVGYGLCKYNTYSKLCCKACVEAGMLDPQEAKLQAAQPSKIK